MFNFYLGMLKNILFSVVILPGITPNGSEVISRGSPHYNLFPESASRLSLASAATSPVRSSE